MFASRQATVIGPVPPGIGVTAPATARTSSKRTSPAIFPSSPRLTPTSNTAAPGFTCSAPIRPGLPAAATRMSASRVSAARSAVRECARVTVASTPFRPSISSIGTPTSRERPSTTARLPEIGISYAFSSSITPSGVHGLSPGNPAARRPRLTSVRPSTSFSGGTARSTRAASSGAGSGICTRMPCTVGSSARMPSASSSSSSAVSAGSARWRETMPASPASRTLRLT